MRCHTRLIPEVGPHPTPEKKGPPSSHPRRTGHSVEILKRPSNLLSPVEFVDKKHQFQKIIKRKKLISLRWAVFLLSFFFLIIRLQRLLWTNLNHGFNWFQIIYGMPKMLIKALDFISDKRMRYLELNNLTKRQLLVV